MNVENPADLTRLALEGFRDWASLGLIRTARRGDLVLLTYNKQAQATWTWGPVERMCRGLILNEVTGEIVARPFDKFFNWGSEGTTDAPLVAVQEKLDGSLGILYRDGDEHRIATRGSFDSPQAQWATEWLANRTAGESSAMGADLADRVTLLFEIVYPENRIVVDYGARAELVLLAARDRIAGNYATPQQVAHFAQHFGFGLPRVHPFEHPSEIVERLPTLEGEEGYVGIFADGSRWKFKGDEYRKLHRFATQLTFPAVVEAMLEGRVTEALDCVPDHRRGDFLAMLASAVDQAARTEVSLEEALGLAPRDDRKTFALWAKDNAKALMPLLFARLDGRPTRGLLHKHFVTEGGA